MYNVKSNFGSLKLVHVRVDGTGTARLDAGGEVVTLTDNGTGDYSLTLRDTNNSIVAAYAMPLTDDVVISKQTQLTTSVARFECRALPVGEVTASVTFDSAIKFHSSLIGADGNDITIQMADATTAGSEAVASVSDAGVIVINIEGGVSTATQVHAALMDSDLDLAEEARNFVSSEVLVGATAIATAGATALSGGVDAVAAAASDAEFDVLLLISEV